jgi:chaperonin GroES
VRSIELADRVLFEPEDRGQVELQGIDYVLLRERDIHAVAADRHSSAGTGLYL